MRRSTNISLRISGGRPLLAATVAATVAAGLLTGCATILNGTEQKIIIESDRPGVQVKLDHRRPKPLPVTLSLPRKGSDLMVLRILTPRADSSGGVDTVRLLADRRFSHVTWLNFVTGVYGLAGLGVDVLSGGAWRIDPDPRRRAPSHVRITADPDPWSTGTWRGSVAWMAGLKTYPDDAQPGANLRGELAVQGVVGHRAWPHELEGRLYFHSSLEPAGEWAIAELGARKTLGNLDGLRPYLSGGLSLLSGSTQPHGGMPIGVWARAGADIRGGTRFFAGPYVGFAKYEPVVAGGVNTGGVTGGLLLGVLW